MIRKSTIKIRRLLVAGLAVLTFNISGKAQQFSVGNNLVYSATLTPNLSLETRLDSSWTMGISGGYRPWPTDDNVQRKYRHLSLDLYARKWKKDNQWKGWYYGFDALWVHYNLSNIKLHYFGMFKDASHHRIQGNLLGIGSFGGYAVDLGSGFGVDFQAGADLSWTHHTIFYEVHCGLPIARKNRIYIIPKIAVNVSWRF